VLPDEDRIIQVLLRMPSVAGFRVLEVGCGSARRLHWLHSNMGLECHGIEPSARATAEANARGGISVVQGTADQLPFPSNSFDIVIFGFCLYLCDRSDLFRIASEADRALKESGYLIIHDFFSPSPRTREYHHLSGIMTHKMDFRTLFTWHPHYSCWFHEVAHHGGQGVTDDVEEWVSTSLLRKVQPAGE
jgi:ubiquinone/menaquinone biosynthesis C-methylase UbiE